MSLLILEQAGSSALSLTATQVAAAVSVTAGYEILLAPLSSLTHTRQDHLP